MATTGVYRQTKNSCKWIIGFIGSPTPIHFSPSVLYMAYVALKDNSELEKTISKAIDRAQVK